ncbi:MAG: hypothetical protein QGG62_00425 [Candidatus Poseidoniaceae archaeon]|nr:hypothetical protein [Candidatus Poseidoniaceae archaeon]
MRHRHVIAVLLMALFFSGIALTTVQGIENISYEAGYVEWEMDFEQRLYVEGEDAETSVLQRARPDATLGFTDVNPGGGPSQIFELTSPPLVNSMKGTINMSTYFSAYIVPIAAAVQPTTCTSSLITSPPGDDDSTTLTILVSISGTQVYETTITEEIDKVSSNDPTNFSGEILQIDIDLQAGDTFTLTLIAQHNCEGTRARIQWGGFETNAGGIIMTGKVYEPSASISIDSSRRAHIEFLPILPWGVDDVLIDGDGEPSVSWVLRGPLDVDEKTNRDRDMVMESSIGRIRMERSLGNNETAWIWTGKAVLQKGTSNLEVCVKTTSGNPNADCHAFGIIRFEVDSESDGFASAGLWLSLSTIICFIGFAYKGFNAEDPLPLPILIALLLMMLLMLPVGFSQSNLDTEAQLNDNALLIDAELKSSGAEFTTLSELMGDSKVLAIGVIAPGSESAQDQANELGLLLGQRDDVAIVQIVIGEESMMSDVEAYRSSINSSWPIVLDYNQEFVSTSPTGNADSLVLVDKSMHVTWSQSPTGGAKDMNDAIEAIDGGGPTSLGTYFSILFPTGLFLVFLALPRQGWTKPEEPLPPGALWASIVLAGGLGAMLIHLPPLLLSILPVSTSISHIVSVIMFLWFVFMCTMTLRRGAPSEADFLGSFIYGRMPESFQAWRPKEDMQRDVLLGIFVGWLSWMVDPGLVAQGVGAAALNGGMGIFFAILLLLGNVLIAGLAILILRFIASWGGPFSNIFGRVGADTFARFMGLVLIPISIWATINGVLAILSIGVF